MILYLLGWTIISTRCAQAKFSYWDHNYITIINNFLQNEEISKDCLNQLWSYYNGFMAMEPWAWKMLDAHGSIPSGVLVGNFFDLGNYDECLSIKTDELGGKYCLGSIPRKLISAVMPRTLTKDTPFETTDIAIDFSGIKSAVCIPDKCTAEDAQQMYSLAFFSEKYCYSQDTSPRLNGEAITTIAILSFFLLLALTSTVYDVYLYYKGQETAHAITTAFSYLTNGKQLIATTTFHQNSDHILCLHGLKAISMMWIVLAHEYSRSSYGAITNFKTLLEFPQTIGSMVIFSSTLAVDTFFVVGGLITVYNFLKAVDKGVKFNLFFYYLHRYIRLTPAFAIVVLIHATLLKSLGDGPLWNGVDHWLIEPCQKYYWAALLYIQNYVHDHIMCVPQSWYLSMDMQLFILSPLVLFPLIRKPKWTIAGLTVLTAAGIVIPFLVVYFNELVFSYNEKDTEKFMFYYYEQTYCRFGTYVIGMILGYFIYKIKQGNIKIKLNLLTALFLWAICLAGGLACVFAGHNVLASEYDKWSNSFYISFNSPSWSLVISGIIFLCVSGYGGPVNAFLSAPIFQFLAKISYAIYLVHYELISVRALSCRTEFVIGFSITVFNFLGDFILTATLASILCLTFEIPMITIEKLLFAPSDSSKCKEKASLNV